MASNTVSESCRSKSPLVYHVYPRQVMLDTPNDFLTYWRDQEILKVADAESRLIDNDLPRELPADVFAAVLKGLYFQVTEKQVNYINDSIAVGRSSARIVAYLRIEKISTEFMYDEDSMDIDDVDEFCREAEKYLAKDIADKDRANNLNFMPVMAAAALNIAISCTNINPPYNLYHKIMMMTARQLSVAKNRSIQSATEIAENNLFMMMKSDDATLNDKYLKPEAEQNSALVKRRHLSKGSKIATTTAFEDDSNSMMEKKSKLARPVMVVGQAESKKKIQAAWIEKLDKDTDFKVGRTTLRFSHIQGISKADNKDYNFWGLTSSRENSDKNKPDFQNTLCGESETWKLITSLHHLAGDVDYVNPHQ
jgi:hypothetical protein